MTSQMYARLFADYCLLYRHIRNDKDSADLQTDFSVLEDWETKWQIHFHLENAQLSESAQTSVSGGTPY